MQPILLATDGSDQTRSAADRAIELASDADVALHVLCVIDSRVHSVPGLSSGELSAIAVEDRGHEFIEWVMERAASSDVPVEHSIQYGVPEDVVLEYAAGIDASRIVLGEHGDHRMHLGGVGRRIAEETDRDVEITPPPA